MTALWGKLAQNENSSIVSFINKFHGLLEFVNDSTIEVTSLDFINENLARTAHRKTWSSCTVLKDRDVVKALFITTYAHLELFEILHELGYHVSYFDVNSVIFVSTSEIDLKTGEFLGDLTDKLNSNENQMSPKNGLKIFVWQARNRIRTKRICTVRQMRMEMKSPLLTKLLYLYTVHQPLYDKIVENIKAKKTFRLFRVMSLLIVVKVFLRLEIWKQN